MNKKKEILFKKETVYLAVAVLLIAGAIIYLEGMKAAPVTGNAISLNRDDDLKEGIYPKAPELAGISDYLNTNGEEIKLSDLKGKVVLVDFWTYTCVNCIRTLPFLTSWDEKYRDAGLVIVGVHTPEFEFEKERENVLEATERHGIEYPVVQDNSYATWKAFKNRFWPHKYLIDAEGYIRYDHIGEGAYEETELKIQELLAEIGESVEAELTEEKEIERERTSPEIYAGYNFALPRNQNIGNREGLQPNQIVDYRITSDEINPSQIYLNGAWQSNSDNLRVVSKEGTIVLGFAGKEVNIVAFRDSENPVEMDVVINGDYVAREQAGKDVRFKGKRAFVRVDQARMYNVIEGEQGVYVLGLRVKEGFGFNAFTFG